MLDTYEHLQMVLEGGGSRQIRDIYGIDTKEYTWVDLYLRDKATRAQIKVFEQEIPRVEALPIHRDELKERFLKVLQEVNKLMYQRVNNHLFMVQNRKESLMSPETVLSMRIVYPLNLTADEIDDIFSEMPLGVSQVDIEKSVQEIREKITSLKHKIDAELSPQSRWVHFDSGCSMPYPGGCRWTKFVEDWKKVASRFQGNVNIDGRALESDEETMAFFALGIDKVRKLEPLRKPHIKPPKQKSAGELYNESVFISRP